MVETRAHPDLHVIAPTPPASNPKGARAIRIDAIRELERQASLRPVMASRKVFIVDDADRMTDDSPQAFLKTLEEPPDRTVMILVLDRARAVPATVISRCQLVRFRPGDQGPPPETADALALLDRVSAGGMATLLTRADRLERDKAQGMVDAYWLWCRDLLLAKAEAPEDLYVNRDRASDLAREALRWSADDIVAAIDLCRDAREALAHNVTPRLTIEVVVSRLALRAG
jgi:DNA polymerase-3 subunit delta'